MLHIKDLEVLFKEIVAKVYEIIKPGFVIIYVCSQDKDKYIVKDRLPDIASANSLAMTKKNNCGVVSTASSSFPQEIINYKPITLEDLSVLSLDSPALFANLRKYFYINETGQIQWNSGIDGLSNCA